VALLVAKGDVLSGFLGDAEGPSHENWLSEYVKDSYSYAPQTISAVKSALANLYEVVMGGEDNDTIEGALKEFFSINEPERKHKDAVDTSTPKVEPLQARPAPIKIRRSKNGFKIKITPEGENIIPFDLRVRAAYRVRMSDPFRAYSKDDFAFNEGGLNYDCEGAKDHSAANNVINIRGVDKGFILAASGFDPNREIAVEWNMQDAEEA